MKTSADLPPAPQPSVLFVCTGNICRSPMAAGLFRARLTLEGQDWRGWRIDSAGTGTLPGYQAAMEAQQVMARRGIDITAHRSQEVSHDLLSRYQLILTMEAYHKEVILAEFSEFEGRVYMLSEMSGEIEDVEDPVGGTVAEFDQAADVIDSWLKSGFGCILALACPPGK